MQDIQNNHDTRNIEIEEVGIKDMLLPLYIKDKANQRQQVVARIKTGVDLKAEQKGTHMSRFIEIIENYRNYNFDNDSLMKMLHELKQKLSATSAFVEAAFDYFIEKDSPVSKKKSLMSYKCKISGQTNSHDKAKISLCVEVPISSVCPCSLAISKNGAHNQRGLVILDVKINQFVWLEELISLVEKWGGSGEVYSLSKRSDEKYVTEKMFDNPKFVEDVVRDIAVELKKDKRIDGFCVECINQESIHNHNAYAQVKG